jgi:hypothetical protein
METRQGNVHTFRVNMVKAVPFEDQFASLDVDLCSDLATSVVQPILGDAYLETHQRQSISDFRPRPSL